MNSRNRKGRAFGAVLCTAAMVFSSGASADTTTSESIRINYVSAQLTTPERVQELYSRIRQAASMVCYKPTVAELVANRLYQQCFDRAVDGAVAKVDSSALTALHRSRIGRGAVG